MTEHRLRDRIRAALTSTPRVWILKITPDGQTRAGTPDFLLCVQGYFLALEVKQPGGKPTLLQRYELNRIRRAGGASFTVTSVADVLAIIEGIKLCPRLLPLANLPLPPHLLSQTPGDYFA